VLPITEIQKILKTFEEKSFKDICSTQQLLADRGGVLLEVRYLKQEMRIIKADSVESFVIQDDKEKFKQCEAIVEKYLSEY